MLVMRKETIIKVECKSMQWNTDVTPYKRELKSIILPITYPLKRSEALGRFYSSRDSLLGDIVSVEEIEKENIIDKLISLFK